jgi:CRP-like cAMP-binding protein
MGLQFFIVYPLHQGRSIYMVKDHKLIIRNYLKGWFPVDFISVLPFDLLGIVMQRGDMRQLKILRVVRLLRLLKLARLVRGLRILKRWEVEIGMSYRRLTMLGLVLTAFLSAHWISCGLGIINGLQGDVCNGSDDDSADCTTTWFSPAAKELVVNGDAITSERRYIIALYVTATLLVHPHVLPPQNEYERIPFIFLIFLGGFIWTRVISRSTALITSMDRHTIHFHQTMDDLNATSKENGLPHFLRRRLRAFFMNTRDSSQRQTWTGLIGRMSPELKTEVLYEISRDWIRRVRYLRGTSKLFLQDLTMHLKTHLYAHSETFGDNFMMYIMRTGMCNWTKGQGKMCIMRPGDIWGEEHLFLTNFELLRPNTTTTISFTEVLSLAREAFQKVYADYPEYKDRMRKFHVWYIFSEGILVYAQKQKRRSATNLSLCESQCLAQSDIDYGEDKSAEAHRRKELQQRRHLQKASVASASKNQSSESANGRVLNEPSEIEKRLTARLDMMDTRHAESEKRLTAHLNMVDTRQAEFSTSLDAVHVRLDAMHTKQAALESLIRDGFAALSTRLAETTTIYTPAQPSEADELVRFHKAPAEASPQLPFSDTRGPPLPGSTGYL